MSAIRTIYNSIESMDSMTYDSDSYDSANPIPCRDLDELRETSLKSGDAPIRILSLPNPPVFEFAAMGKGAVATWFIRDTFYYKPVSQGEGLRKAWEKLVVYTGSYMEAIRNNRMPTGQSEIESAEFDLRSDLLWGSEDTPYFGVEVTLTVIERLQS
jgi:hypothetical protein